MSLQVWLPLNGNLNNQGLDGVVATNNGATLDDNGKIGKCYSFSGSNSISLPKVILPSNTSEWSFACWFNLANTTTSSAMCLFSERTGGNEKGYTIFIYSSNSKILVDDGVRWTVTPMTFSASTWYHLVVTRNSEGKKIYINGELKSSTSTVGSTTSINTNGCLIGMAQSSTALTTGNQGFIGKLNDVRIYDHCLSQKEIKELSKGLVLHYKLSGFGEENLFGNGSDFQTSLDGFSNKLNFSITTEDGIKCAHATGALKTSAYIYSKIPFTPQPNEWVTLSAYVKIKNIVRGTTNPMCEFYFSGQTIDGTWRSVTYKDFRVDGIKVPISSIGFDRDVSFNINDNKWHYVSATVQWQNYTFTSNIPPAIYLRDCTGDIYVHHIKYERGDKATLWCPNSEDAMYTTHGFNTTIEDDCSGYGHNGTKTGSLTLSSDTPRYATSTVFNGSSYITVQNNDYAIQGIEEMSCSVWAYDDDWSTYSGRIYSCTEGGGINIEQSGTKLQWAINAYSNAEKTSYSYPSSLYITIENSTLSPGWHLFTWTYTTEGTKVYVDGVLKVTKTATSYGIHFNNTAPLIIGGEATTTGATTPYLTGKLSDFRIYATALSADDVKELYQVSTSIDNQGNLHTYEVIER